MTKHKCWYCHEERQLGDMHMYHCVVKIVNKEKVEAMEQAVKRALEVKCPVEHCETMFKGAFAEIVIQSVGHFEKYHKEEL